MQNCFIYYRSKLLRFLGDDLFILSNNFLEALKLHIFIFKKKLLDILEMS
jgi:hypothetical protein